MKVILSLALFVCCGLYLSLVHADPNPVASVAAAAGQAALQAAVSTAAQAVQQSLTPQQITTGPVLATIGALIGAYNLILAGFQQLFGLGARSSNTKLAAASSKALSVTQHLAGSPDVATKSS